MQLDDTDFITLVDDCLADSHRPPDRLVLEITETAVLNSPFAIERLKALSARGVGIAIDDFGTGYSALTTLGSLPVDLVKIDKSFVAGIASHPRTGRSSTPSCRWPAGWACTPSRKASNGSTAAVPAVQRGRQRLGLPVLPGATRR